MSSEKMKVTCAGEKWCPVTATAKLIGRKWHPVVILELCQVETLGFNDLQRAVGGISNKVLSDTLEDLEEKGFVDREIANEKPVRVEYSLTEFGDSLAPVILAMAEWGMEHLEPPEGVEMVTLPDDFPR
ncbi:winged helix-turn-helix transcriptional regulator [Haloarcula salinisoli]|uniref:Helix-turn-helix transcriptional regulator n=1 Tax=Haloarcula salinisoli TaxID=2487746 RepID=A0A8J7YKF3_9EURY|nr:helix-turn-helix domain-containing protein [Halomicroarcula salinisoli]MBX0288163.1 helix-turn-helix transcriptional regulator [Halomicroarcula salinisoli]MBX0305313.1 helix-turn-helix transcriptional regulator [Halomicroarcula salinisoli]